MLLEVREVSRKTPLDGRLEISLETARRLSPFGSSITIEIGALRETAAIEAMDCQCAKRGGGARHTHHFLTAKAFASLPAGETVVLELLDGPVIAVARPHPLTPEG